MPTVHQPPDITPDPPPPPRPDRIRKVREAIGQLEAWYAGGLPPEPWA